MPLFDWRDLEPALLTEVWEEQASRWSERLFWDAGSNWAQVEEQRCAGRLPGLALLHGREIAAWSFFLVHQDTLQIGAFESDSSASTRILLDGALGAVDPSVTPSGAMLFAFSAAPGLVPALVARGFDTERYLHLVRDTAALRPERAMAAWEPGSAAQVPALLAAAYGPPVPTRPFARHSRMDEWREYAAQLLGSEACGTFEPGLSASVLSPAGVLEGVVLTTVVSPTTAHIAQVAVDPARRGGGAATRLVRAVLEQARAAGYERVSLLVSERNTAARRLYARLGFNETASFVAAGRPGAATRQAADVAHRATV